MLDNTGMQSQDETLHTYSRTQRQDGNDSLVVIAGKILDGQVVLDLGMGVGMLGQLLSEKPNIAIDGVTHNATESEIGRRWYRAVQVADLEAVGALDSYASATYDCIVCADVLEHLKEPQRTLRDCARLLKPNGNLIVSIPNLAYAGLLAELLQGEFQYRTEGLLDKTHLRFFTQNSLKRFFRENGWSVIKTGRIERNILESEFKVAFDSLPPAVSRYLLGLPDAFCYQFVWELRQTSAGCTDECDDNYLTHADERHALFSSQLYLQMEGRYSEANKSIALGCIGVDKQILRFELPPSETTYSALRLDPADRPGFFRIQSLELRAKNGGQWRWSAEQSDSEGMGRAQKQEMTITSFPGFFGGALWILTGNDPWIELPIPSSVLIALSETGGYLEATVGWPMSADFMQASIAINAIESIQKGKLLEITDELSNANQAAQSLLNSVNNAQKELQIKEQHIAQLNVQIEVIRQEFEVQQQDTAIKLAAMQEEAANAAQQLMDRMQQDKAQAVAQLTERHAIAQNQMAQEVKQIKEALHGEKNSLLAELNQTREERNRAQSDFFQVAAHVENIERSRLFKWTRPISQFKGWLDKHIFGNVHAIAGAVPERQVVSKSKYPIDIIVPVFKGFADTQRCLQSVLSAQNSIAWRLVVINDCSPEPELTDWLREFAKCDARITLLENQHNLGFVETVNRGMSLSKQSDVVLLNSDTEVANDWLDRLVLAAHSQAKVATVTPFSNNATICSYPKFCASNALPEGHNTASLDRVFARCLAGQVVEVPTGVGFCMYITRACLKSVGLFDVKNFGKGYGEENDFCVRANNLGWVNLHALDVFVMHSGGISFGDSKSEREMQAMDTLRRLHPNYERSVHLFLAQDPAKSARALIDFVRLMDKERPIILNVVHDRQGGTLRHVSELADYSLQRASFLRLTPTQGGVILSLEGEGADCELIFQMPNELPVLVATLKGLGVSHIHFHHLLGHHREIADLPRLLNVPHDFTVHDYYSICPQISLTNETDQYCRESGVVQCSECVKKTPAPTGEDIVQWRSRGASLLSRSRFVLAPSSDAATRIQSYVPSANVVVASHNELNAGVSIHRNADAPRLNPNEKMRILVLGALSKIKGADVLEDVAQLACETGANLEFHLLGYGYRSLKTHPKASLTVHGKYQDQELVQLINEYNPHLVWFPAQWPETFSYTLSAALESGFPIAVTNLGALQERLVNREWAWVCDWSLSPKDWLAFFNKIRLSNIELHLSPDLVVPKLQHDFIQGSDFRYSTNYLDGIGTSMSPSNGEIAKLQSLIDGQSAKNTMGLYRVPGTFKGFLLKSLVYFRSSRALSRMAKYIPAHRQRRIKTWLSS